MGKENAREKDLFQIFSVELDGSSDKHSSDDAGDKGVRDKKSRS
jgi:hypothetical protein